MPLFCRPRTVKTGFSRKKEFSFPESPEKELIFNEVDKYTNYRISIDRFHKKPIPAKKWKRCKLLKMQKISYTPLLANYFHDTALTFLCTLDKIKLVKTEEEYLIYQE